MAELTKAMIKEMLVKLYNHAAQRVDTVIVAPETVWTWTRMGIEDETKSFLERAGHGLRFLGIYEHTPSAMVVVLLGEGKCSARTASGVKRRLRNELNKHRPMGIELFVDVLGPVREATWRLGEYVGSEESGER